MGDAKDKPPDPEMGRSDGVTWLPALVVLAYAVVAIAWILFSDDVVDLLFADRERVAAWQTYKGVGFVVITAGVLYTVLRRRMVLIERASRARRRAEKEVQLLNAQLEQRINDRTAELEAKNRELARFTYTVSHDLKAPLTRIEGFAALLEEEHASALNDEGRRFVATIRRSAMDTSRLIADLLSYAKAEQRELRLSSTSLVPLVKAIVAEFQPELDARGGTVGLFLEVDGVTADQDGLSAALRNLVANAIKFTPRDRPPQVEIGSRREGAKCVLWVRDNGIGFDMTYHDRMFQIFERLCGSEYPGTGVGLAIVLKSMERMGGTARADSSPGCGATFYLEFPSGSTPPAGSPSLR